MLYGCTRMETEGIKGLMQLLVHLSNTRPAYHQPLVSLETSEELLGVGL